MKRVAVGLIVVLALTGCVPGVAESKTNRTAADGSTAWSCAAL